MFAAFGSACRTAYHLKPVAPCPLHRYSGQVFIHQPQGCARVNHSSLAALLVDAYQNRRTISPEQIPADKPASYAVQQEVLRLRGAEVGGWKLGSKSSTGPIQGAMLPADCLLASGAELEFAAYTKPAIELEIAFRLNRAFTPRDERYSDAEVLGAIGSMGTTIEIVASRINTWPKVEPLLSLADLLNHGALIVGDFIDYDAAFPFIEPALSFTYAGEDIVPGDGVNPAGDPRRLLPWLVNHYTSQGLTLTPDIVITTGSYTGMHFPTEPGVAVAEIRGLPGIGFSFI
jgi:2-keto-4-pentenoate hydratase